jgi:hypothetical protein
MDDHSNVLLQTAFEACINSRGNGGGLLVSRPLHPQPQYHHQDALYPNDGLTNLPHHIGAQTVHPANPTSYESYRYLYSYESQGPSQKFLRSLRPLQYHSSPGCSSIQYQYASSASSTQYQPSSNPQSRPLRAIAPKLPPKPILPAHTPPKPPSQHANKTVVFCLNSDPQTPMLGIVGRVENDTWLHLRKGTSTGMRFEEFFYSFLADLSGAPVIYCETSRPVPATSFHLDNITVVALDAVVQQLGFVPALPAYAPGATSTPVQETTTPDLTGVLPPGPSPSLDPSPGFMLPPPCLRHSSVTLCRGGCGGTLMSVQHSYTLHRTCSMFCVLLRTRLPLATHSRPSLAHTQRERKREKGRRRMSERH